MNVPCYRPAMCHIVMILQKISKQTENRNVAPVRETRVLVRIKDGSHLEESILICYDLITD